MKRLPFNLGYSSYEKHPSPLLVPSERMRTDIVPFNASQLPIWLLISFISSMLLLARLLGFHYPFLCRNIHPPRIVVVGEFILSRCLCLIDLRVADLALRPSLGWRRRRVDKVTYSPMIDIFIRRGGCFKNLKRGHLSGARHLAARRPTCPSPSIMAGGGVGRGVRRPELSPWFALSVGLKDGAGLKMAARDSSRAGSVYHDRTWPSRSTPPLCDQYRYQFSAHQHDTRRLRQRSKFAGSSVENSFPQRQQLGMWGGTKKLGGYVPSFF